MRSTIEMAREAGFTPARDEWVFMDMLKAFEALVRADEREACALICTNIANKPSNVILGVAIDCAAAIRARGEAT
jgi:hypothetical protein